MKTKITLVVAFAFLLNVQAQDLTIPPKKYADSIKLENKPLRLNDKFPLSDQNNTTNWTLLKGVSDEFESKNLNQSKWFPNNPKWKGRQPTFFHPSNVSFDKGELVIKVNQHGKDILPDGYTHTTGFIVSKEKFLYGYFEAECKLMDAPWVSGFWMSNGTKDWWTEIDICENAPGIAANRHDLNSNIHVFKSPVDQGDVKSHFSRTEKYYFPEELQADYHVWGLEWTADYIRFYIDGVLFREAKNTHWYQPLQINFNCESNKWFGALPDDNRLNGEMRVKYFRAWQFKK